MDAKGWNDLAAQLRVDSIRSTTAANSGHPTSSMSAADLTAVLIADHLRTDVADPHAPANDRFVLSKGHASPLLYAAFKAMGAITDDQLLTFRTMGSPVQGHPAPVPEMPWVDVATGSLGQGLPVSLGMALAMRLDGAPGRVWCLMGDSETAEGSVWESMGAASFHEIDNLIAIVDMNRLGQRGPTMLGWDGDAYVRRAQSFGWQALEVDGHDVEAIHETYLAAEAADAPVMIVARTRKGQGVSFVADVEGWHGKPLPPDEAAAAIEELGGRRDIVVTPPSPEGFKPVQLGELTSEAAPSYTEGIATRKAFGQALAWLAGHRPDLVVLDGEVGNSTYTDDFERVAPERFFQMYIAEQTMVGAQVGLQALGKTAFSSTFGAFYTRAQDFVRMAAISRANLRLCGSHAGISIGEDGPSQMALEDLACMRAVHGSTVLYPADGNATVKMVTAMCDLEGISYLRTTREQTPMLYGPDEEFPVGGSKTLRSSPHDRATIVAAGITLVEALGAADALEAEGVRVRVIDLYCVKPADAETLRTALIETGVIVTAEDHWAEGGIGDAVLDALASAGDVAGRIVKVAPREMPGSGAPKELRDWAGISADRIAGRVREELTLG